jgi:hypothetical protein
VRSDVDEGIAPVFFFPETVAKTEENQQAIIDRLYMGVKRDKFQDSFLTEKIQKVGKEIVARSLCERLNVSVDRLFEMDYNFCWRMLYAMHVEKAYELRRSQWAEQQRK